MEDILKRLDDLGKKLYEKFGTDSYIERCELHDIKELIKKHQLPKGALCDIISHNADIMMSGKCGTCGGDIENY